MTMPKGPTMELGGGGPDGPSLAKSIAPPNLSIGKLAALPIKFITNPMEGLRSLASLGGGGGNNPLDKVLSAASNATSLLKGSPKILLNEAMGTDGALGGGAIKGATSQIANTVSNAAGSVAGKGVEMGTEALGKGAGVASELTTQLTGNAIAAIPVPVVCQAIGGAISATAPAINQAVQLAAKVSGKVMGQVAKQLVKTAVKTAVKMTVNMLQKGIQAGIKRGPQKLVGKRTIQGKKPQLLNPMKIAKAILNQAKALQRQLTGAKMKKTGQRTFALGKKAGGLLSKTVGGTMRVGQNMTRFTVKLSEAQKAVATGRTDLAIGHLKDAGNAAKGTVSEGILAPSKAVAGKALRSRHLLKKALPKALSKRGQGQSGIGQTVLKGLQKSTPGTPGQSTSAPAKPSSGLTITKPFRVAKSAIQSVKNSPPVKTISKAFRLASKPVKVGQALTRSGTQLVHGGKDLAQLVNQTSSASKAMAHGDTSAVVDNLHSSTNLAAGLPGRAQAAAAQLRPGFTSTGTKPSVPAPGNAPTAVTTPTPNSPTGDPHANA